MGGGAGEVGPHEFLMTLRVKSSQGRQACSEVSRRNGYGIEFRPFYFSRHKELGYFDDVNK